MCNQVTHDGEEKCVSPSRARNPFAAPPRRAAKKRAHLEGGCASARTGRWAFRQPTTCKDHGHPPGLGRVARGQARVPGDYATLPLPARILAQRPHPAPDCAAPPPPARGPPSSAPNKARAKGPAAAGELGTGGWRPCWRGAAEMGERRSGGRRTKERAPAPRPRPAPPGSPPRPGRQGALCGRRPLDNAPLGPAPAALTCAPGQAAALLARPQPAPLHGPVRPTPAPRRPHLLAAGAAVHRLPVTAVARSRSRRPQPEPDGASPPPLPRRGHRPPPQQPGRTRTEPAELRRPRRPGAWRRRPTAQARWSGAGEAGAGPGAAHLAGGRAGPELGNSRCAPGMGGGSARRLGA
ncbi:uncharacterized protein LOC108591704 [Callithrix jacchus]